MIVGASKTAVEIQEQQVAVAGTNTTMRQRWQTQEILLQEFASALRVLVAKCW